MGSAHSNSPGHSVPGLPEVAAAEELTPLDYMRMGRCNYTPLGGTWRATTIDEVFKSYLAAYWKRPFALTLGRKVPELGGQRIAPLIGSFVVGDVFVVKKK